MQRKIKADDLRLGMYIDKFGGKWIDHPFWRKAFLLEDQKDLDTILKSGIAEVWIDTSKGKDVETASTQAQIVPSPAIEESAIAEEHTALEEELIIARETLDEAKEATISMFQEARMGKTIEVTEAEPLVEKISESVVRNPGAMLSLTRIKTVDDYTYMHSVAVCALMIALGKELDYEGDLLSLGMAGLLHDVGKMAIDPGVLNKPGKLTDEEFEAMKTHPRRGWEMLKEGGGVNEIALDVCLHHHERVDGRGYPDSLADKDISLVAKMGAVCDVYDAITSERCYKHGWEPADALKKMASWKDGHFDEHVFQAFVKSIGIYPTGTLVKLQSGRLGIVTEQSDKTLLTPIVKVFYSISTHTPIPTSIIDLSNSQETIDSIEDPAAWDLSRERILEIL